MDSSPVEIDDAALKLPQFELEDIENVSCEESYKTGSMCKQKYIHTKLQITVFITTNLCSFRQLDPTEVTITYSWSHILSY